MEENPELKKICTKIILILMTFSIALSFGNYQSTHATLAIDEYQATLDEMVILINEAREEAGMKPLYEVPVLNNASLVRDLESVEVFSHTRPDGSEFQTVLNEYQITSYKGAAENLAAGSPTVEETFEQWKNSPPHWASMMNSAYTHIGVSYCYDDDSTYGWYWHIILIATDDEMDEQYVPERYAVVPSCCGDVDGDGAVSTCDFILVIESLKKNVILNDLQLESADCMQDGAVTIADAIVLKKYILGIYDSLPRVP
jgi:uncharacterized protein YkwD